jgi:very-short-patch-repair endonuclease
MKVSRTVKKRMKRDFLIALMNNKRDFRIAQEQCWYRIPVKTKQVPKSVINKSLKHIAFYHTKEFGQDAYCIRWYGKVKNISIVKRKELITDLPNDPKANDEYYKIEFDKLCSRAEPIISHRPRRILFIPTTLWHFQRASEINEVFYESPLEEEFWKELRDEKIDAERQFLVNADSQTFLLDFALFCKVRNIDIECDGDEFHLENEDVKRDKKRNNILESFGWSVLRFTTDEIQKSLKEVINRVKKTVNQLGGLQDIVNQTVFRFLDDGSPQLRLL